MEEPLTMRRRVSGFWMAVPLWENLSLRGLRSLSGRWKIGRQTSRQEGRQTRR